ncbi:MAG: DegT/DnrJ/EryC1/StrS family aminotransferase, partial [Chloroflexi bacterium]|nr:DegT/DnrJ/EryC1/StrS family aminotransferase [Chloroflexota bacterium]
MCAILAIDGGKPVRPTMLRAGFHGSAEINDHEIESVLEVLRAKRLFRFLAEGAEASKVALIERWYCERLGRKYALAVNGGTSALIAGLFGVDVGPGDEVI